MDTCKDQKIIYIDNALETWLHILPAYLYFTMFTAIDNVIDSAMEK